LQAFAKELIFTAGVIVDGTLADASRYRNAPDVGGLKPKLSKLGGGGFENAQAFEFTIL
jgi:hypothetical protein